MNSSLQTQVTIVYPEIRAGSGTKSYVTNLFSGLDLLKFQYSTIPIVKREISILGRPFFGFISQYLNSAIKTAGTPAVHSLSPSTIIRDTNIVTVHDILPLIREDLYLRTSMQKKVFKIGLKRTLSTPLILLSSNVVKQELLSKLSIDDRRLRVVPLSINHRTFYPTEEKPAFPEGKIIVVMVSDFNPRKRIDLVVRALRGQPDIEFYHMGPVNAWKSSHQEIMLLAKGAQNIHFLGEVDPVILRNYLSSADIFVFLTEAEGFGFPPLEAMACGTNVLVSDISIFHETMGNLPIFVTNSEFCADDVRNAIKRKHPSKELVESSMKYSLENYARKMVGIYSEFGQGR